MKNEETKGLDLEDLDVILDLLAEYNPKTMELPTEMTNKKFADRVERTFRKVLNMREEVFQDEFLKNLVIDYSTNN
jgi:hypothetical protein